jgi:hypothetical protein
MRIIDTKVWEGQGLRGKSALNDTKTINECDVRQGVELPLFSELPRAFVLGNRLIVLGAAISPRRTSG